MPHARLDPERVIETIDRLERRIEERFPGSGLLGVCQELGKTARRCRDEAARIAEPARGIRAAVVAVEVLGAAAFAWVATGLHYHLEADAVLLVQVLEPAMNIAILVGLGVLSLSGAEERWKRGKAMSCLHDLRSAAHVVDMHQLTKDPYRTALHLPPTASSPTRNLSPALLERYLDYCSELVSLTSKLAAIVAQASRDPEVSAAAGEIEALATGLSRKIWQKVTVIPRDTPRLDLGKR